MTSKSNMVKPLILGAVLGSVISVVTYATLFQSAGDTQSNSATTSERKILYWVGPMSPDYKRDKPGKSPMGMDLIPVYADGGGASNSPGTIKVNPDVINNLGVRTAVAERRELHMSIKTVGFVKYDEDQLRHIHPRVAGWVEKLYVKAAGDPVKKGQPLYDIYSPELVNAQEEWILATDRKNERLIKAAEYRLEALRLPKSALKQLKKTRQVMQKVTMYAPQSGVLDNLAIREGNYIKPGTSLMSIGTLKQVWVEAEVFERQAAQVAIGQPVTMNLDFLPGKDWLGKVDYIYPTLDTKTRTLRVRLRFDNENDALKPNMFAQVIIHSQSSDTSLVVPSEAVIRSGNMDRVVLALGEGRFKAVKVKIGRLDDEYTEILSGLDAGTRVVSSAQFLLDSESSKTSDFKRMDHKMDHDSMKPAKPETMDHNNMENMNPKNNEQSE